MEDLEGHCVGERGCMPFPKVTSDIITHKQADRLFDKAFHSFLGYYVDRIKTFLKK